MRYKDPNSATRQKIILEAFKLFSTKSLTDITFADIEKATRLSRGGILHYFASKEKLYAEIMEHFILKRNNDIPFDPEKNIWDNIKEFIGYRRKQQEYFTNIGIYNVSRAHTCMAANIMQMVDNIEIKSAVWLEKELNYWRKLLTVAQQKGEINKNLDIDMQARLFFNLFFGNSYTSIATPNGCDLDKLQDQFYALYTLIANK